MIINRDNLEQDESVKEKYKEMIKYFFTLQGEKEVVVYHSIASFAARVYLNREVWSHNESKEVDRGKIREYFLKRLYRINEDFIFNVDKCLKLIEDYVSMFVETMYHEWVPDEFTEKKEPVFFMNGWGFDKAISAEDYVKLNKYSLDYIKSCYYVAWGFKYLKMLSD